MDKTLTRYFLALSAPLMALTFVVPLPAGLGDVIFAVLAVAFPLVLMAFGAAQEGRLGPLRWSFVGLLLFFEACVVGMLMLRGQVLEAPWVGGLPLAAAIQFYAFFLAPMIFVAVLYGVTFERFGMRQEDLDALRCFSKEEDAD